MRRSGQLNGATVALELLPRDIEAGEEGRLVAMIDGPPLDGAIRGTVPDLPVSDYCLSAQDRTFSLGSIAALAKMPSSPAEGEKSYEDELAAGNLSEALGKLILAVIAQGGADQRALYRIGIVLAMLSKSREAFAILSLAENKTTEHPASSALRGYLALQNGEVETGRRYLARAALSSRGVPSSRSILHFTQHVLLVHQFNG